MGKAQILLMFSCILEVFFKPLRIGPFVKVKNMKLSVTRSIISSVYSEYFECSLDT